MLIRSLLFFPGYSERKLQRALTSAADALIIDLEDSVAATQKELARQHTSNWLKASLAHAKQWYVRINPLDSIHAMADLDAVVCAALQGIILPKSEPAQVHALCKQLDRLEAERGLIAGSVKIIAITMETPQAVFTMSGYQGVSARLQALTWGAEDLAASLNTINRGPNGYEDVFRLTRTWCLLGASAAQVHAIDTVYPDFKNDAGLRDECVAARRSGFVGKLAIHPDQVAIINEAFAPSDSETAWARQVVAAFTANPDLGAIAIDGKMIDRPHLLMAQRWLSYLECAGVAQETLPQTQFDKYGAISNCINQGFPK